MTPINYGDTTYFNLGRSAFAFLVSEIIRPKRIYLPSFVCWSLVTTVGKRFPEIELVFYKVNKDLSCDYPKYLYKDELLVFVHYFGHENKTQLPTYEGIILEDISHAICSKINYKGHYIFGSLRKEFKIADGGILLKYFNPVYEPSKKLDTWLKFESTEWKDMREAENMIDRNWKICDISSRSLEVYLTSNKDIIRKIRFRNEHYLFDNITIGKTLFKFSPNESPLIHNRMMNTQKERDSLRTYLAKKGVFTSIHWPTHELVKTKLNDIDDILWLESHIISIPVSQDYNLNDMEFIVNSIQRWEKSKRK